MTRLFPSVLAFALVAMLAAGCVSGDAESSDRNADASGGLPTVTVYKTPTCGCCSEWVDHMKQAGFTVETRDVDSQGLTQKKDELGVPQHLRTCHTARVGEEVIEGHVPARAVKGYLQSEAERAQGLAVPGMPIGSPGMEREGHPAQPYNVIAFKADGRTGVFSRENQGDR